jgi:hypothetical protein
MYVCARIENDPVEEPEELAGEAPEQQSVGGGKYPLTYLCPIHSLIHLPHYTFIPKDWLAFVIHVLVYLFWVGLLLFSFMLLLNSNQWTWWEWSMIHCFPSSNYDVILVAFKGLERFLECLSLRTCSLDDRPGKTVQPWGWNGVPLAE